MTERTHGFGLYVHWPFCESKCPYCDFNSHVGHKVDDDAWRNALVSEIARSAAETGPGQLGSIYFGGGTPSLMPPQIVEAVISAAQQAWRFANDIEITLEANPSSVEAERFAAFRQAGVNRVSIGVQALDDDSLRKLGRRHSTKEALRAIEIGQSTFDRLSFDLIYARQDQSLDAWQTELKQALSLGVEHLSLYQLTIEPGTSFGARFAAGGLRGLPEEDLSADLYEVTQTLCNAAGLPAYEVSNHAKPGLESQHNLTYWRGGDYVGVGPGAHGRISTAQGRIATETHLAPQTWLDAVQSKGSGESLRAQLDQTDIINELLMMGLRTLEGIDLRRLVDLDLTDKIPPLVEIGMVSVQENRLYVTAQGRPVLNAILRALLV